MSTIITAGNATNGLTLTPDNTGILELKTGTGAGTTAITADASQNVTVAGTLKAAGVTTNMYPLVSGTSVSPTSGTSVDFTGIPSWAKRITIVVNTATVSAVSTFAVQVITGTSTVVATGYTGSCSTTANGSTTAATSSATRFSLNSTTTTVCNGVIQLLNIAGNTWVSQSVTGNNGATTNSSSGTIDAGAVVTGVRFTTVAGTATFSSGSINILYE